MFLTKKFRNFQLGIGFFSNFPKKNRECSKIAHIYLLWTSSERSLSKIRGPFFPKKKASPRGCFWQKIPKISERNRIFFNFLKKIANVPKLRTFISSELHLSKFWARSETIFFSKKKASLVVGFWKKNPKMSQISNLTSDFFLILQKKLRMFQNIRNLFVLNFIWVNFHQN